MQRFAIHVEPQWCFDGCTRGSRWGDSASARISVTSTGRFDRRNNNAVAICSCRNPVSCVLGGGWYRQREACSVAALGRQDCKFNSPSGYVDRLAARRPRSLASWPSWHRVMAHRWNSARNFHRRRPIPSDNAPTMRVCGGAAAVPSQPLATSVH